MRNFILKAIPLLVLLGVFTGTSWAQETEELPGSEECAMCHEPGRMSRSRSAGDAPNFGEAALRSSPHAEIECNMCHMDLMGADIPHEEKLEKVDCSICHSDQAEQFDQSLHGQAIERGDNLAPTCTSCHGTHDVLSASAPDSPIAVMQIPRMCGQCHREGTTVSETREIHQDHILTNYQDSIHGVGLFRKGLTVTAVCTSCHTAHFVLPHTDVRSSISKEKIADTCEQCHATIEAVHQKVIRGELWEKQPHLVPACVDCHEPHQIRKVFYTEGMANRDCMQCHADPNLSVTRGGENVSLFVNEDELARSRHARTACVQCHTGSNPSHQRPCDTVAEKVDCSICHAETVTEYQASSHGLLLAKGSPDAPACENCHGTHGVLASTNPDSPTFSRNVPGLCADCHRSGQQAAVRMDAAAQVENYMDSIHAKGLLQSGLTVTANCADCHTAHNERPQADPESSVNPANIDATCGRCHYGIQELFENSIHSPNITETDEPLPVCSSCHSAHGIQRIDESNYQNHIVEQCGQCHEQITEEYFETFHGKVSRLGYDRAAKCYDCHGAHDILPTSDARSHLSRENIVETCAKCHVNSHRQFAGYLSHATHHDPDKYPYLYVTFWAMTGLLLGTFAVSWLHTLLWLPRSLQYRKQMAAVLGDHKGQPWVRRFTPYERNLHLMVIFSFLGLGATGMILKFSYTGWAQFVSQVIGGFEATSWIHRFCAVVTFGYFGLHVADLIKKKKASGKRWWKFVMGDGSMMFNSRDLKELIGSLKWFLGKGDRPQYGRWTYWEKFDYFAVFWGVFVIGSTGMILWFPEFFTRLMPGWMVNVATIIHSDEALLATGFIFTIHFFNTHFRPEKFPMDTVVFIRGVPLEEFKHDRPREYQELVESGELESMLMPAPSKTAAVRWRIFGFTALGIGLVLIFLIIYSMLFTYR
jgi:cytochrome b subunit of formate dehydrogenase/uncharacterized protein with PIN domain